MSDLLARARAAADQAAIDGVLQPLQADLHPVAQGGVVFDVRRIRGSVHKPHGDRAADPFTPPYTDALYVEDWPPGHALLLNKFPVLPDHLLLVTRAWADQEDPVDRADWDALDRALGEVPGLGFYNCGRAAGASQPHRHLQIVGRASLGTLPLEPAIRGGIRAGEVTGWPIPHRVAAPSFDAYRRALADLGRDPDRPGAHSLLRGDDWMLIVPRAHAEVDGIPVNSLAYVGLLAVRDEAQLGWVRAHGPWAVLAAAAG